ncbi:ribonuclease H-like domain-containing protein [Tanacetum coccineum]
MPYSSSKRPFNKQIAFKYKKVNKTVNSARTNLVNYGSTKDMPNAVGAGVNAVKSSSCWTWRQNGNIIDHGDPHVPLKDTGIFDSGCSRHMTGNKSYLRIMMEDLLLLLEVLREMCDRKNSVLFTETECLILSPEFKLPDETQVMLKIPRKDNMYSFDLKNIVPSKGLTCLIAKATTDESNMEFSNARTLQQNGVAERKNRTLIEAARTMLADLLLPIPFWAEAINTACYIQNRVLVTEPHGKTPYELLLGRPPTVSFMRHFGFPVTILNTLDHLGKFNGKADEGFLVGYSINSKAFRVYNTRTRKVEENLHVNFLENKENVAGSGPEWLFDINILSKSMNYHTVNAGNRFNGNAGLERTFDAGKEDNSSSKSDVGLNNAAKNQASASKANNSGEDTHVNGTNPGSLPVNSENEDYNSYRITTPVNAAGPSNADDSHIFDLEDTLNLQNAGIFGNSYDDDDVGAEADMNNLETTISVSPIPITRIDKDHPHSQIIGAMDSAVQTRRMNKHNETGLITFINKQRRTNHKDFQNYLFAYFLSQIEPKKVNQALDEESWVEAIQEELLQFKLLDV